MPFRSRSQVRKFGAMVRRGEMSEEKFEEWLHATPNISKLPERVGRKGPNKRKRARSR